MFSLLGKCLAAIPSDCVSHEGSAMSRMGLTGTYREKLGNEFTPRSPVSDSKLGWDALNGGLACSLSVVWNVADEEDTGGRTLCSTKNVVELGGWAIETLFSP